MKRWQQALRALARRPQFAIAVVLILASGIAANTAVFSIVDAVLLKPLPYPDPDRLVTVMEASSAARNQESLIAPPRLEDWNRMNRTFDAIAGSYAENVTDTSSEEPERLAGRLVSPRYFDVFNTKTVIGRTFTADEEVFGGPPAAVISYDFWERRFHRDPGTVGKRLILKDRPFTIVGVMPKEFAGSPIDLWMPAALVPFLMRQRDARFYGGVGRMKPGVTILQAQADIVEVGFDPSQSVTFHVGAAWDEDRKRVGELQKDLIEKFQALPGVTAAGFTNFLPASQATLRYQMELEGIARTEESGKINVGERSISGGYLSAIGAPLLAGTWCPELKAIDTKFPKALVNRRLVEMYANGRNVVGRHFRFADFPPNYPPIEIVGVVGDVREDSVSAAPVAYVYWCIMPGGWPDPDYVVRTRGNPRALLAQIRSVVHDVEPTRAVFGAQPLQNAIDASWEQTRLNTELVAVFGAAALGLASIGLYGLVTLIVTSHRREIGIRMALGAAPGRIVNEVASGVARLLLIGVAVGLVLTLVFQGVLRTVVFEVSPTDLVTLVCAVLLIFATAGAAALVPARRAARIDPATVIGTQL